MSKGYQPKPHAMPTPPGPRETPTGTQDDANVYGSPANVATRIELHIARLARENTTTLLLYEAMKALRAAPAGDARDAEQKAKTSEDEPPATNVEPFGYLDCFGIFYRKRVYANMTPVYSAPIAARQFAGVTDAQTAAARDVLAERQRQIGVEGFDAARDKHYTEGELAKAAACYAAHFSVQEGARTPRLWPWPAAWWKPTTYRHDMVKAGALILAEIERLDRAAGKSQRMGDKS